RGRLFLGIGGRDHFGIRGRIASEFADEEGKQGDHTFTSLPRQVFQWRLRTSR
ncbi:hypothetical protein GOA87_22935, partial [Sinorhizobium meliloti]|nr:hypothetical protein [Sinorhizobium meliloti]MDW9694446.1 hypothetical protein [Sinorhizobium meliloti]MDW9719337.1 hypothetical protein [Sinorhizobium meliloti]MDW9756453.1 hypothetical protein [Sinorhizobium meliloti]